MRRLPDLWFRLRLRAWRTLGRAPKIFCIGFNKTGTTSLHQLFKSLGLRSYHGLRWHDLADEQIYASYECFSDGFPLEWRALVDAYPDSRFVLNVRDCDAWLLSRLRHIARSKQAGTFTGGSSWGLWDDTLEAVVSWIRQWHGHHLDVLGSFESQPERLLVVNWTSNPEAAGRVAAFVGYPGRMERPHANRGQGAENAGRYQGMIEEACRQLGISPTELQNDLLIPSLLERGVEFPARTSRS